METNQAKINEKMDLITMMGKHLATKHPMDVVFEQMQLWGRMTPAQLQAQLRLSYWRKS